VAVDEWGILVASWQLALQADGYSASTVRTYGQAVRSLRTFLADQGQEVTPAQLDRHHVRAWLAEARKDRSQATVRGWFAGVRHFTRFLVAEGEAEIDATSGIKTPASPEQTTRVLTTAELRRLLKICDGSSFVDRRDTAIILLFLDGGLRLGELAGMRVDDADLHDRMVFVVGKGSRRSGPRHRAIPIGVRTARALDRYLRARRRHPYQHQPWLWLGARGRPTLQADSVEAMLTRRSKAAGIPGLHPHQFRHTWASQFRKIGGSEGDLLVLGGWRSRQQLDRYGRASAAERAAESARKYSLGDRL
jgi:site-specific recombinase XerD